MSFFKNHARPEMLGSQLARTSYRFEECKVAYNELLDFVHKPDGDRRGQGEVIAAIDQETRLLRRYLICLHEFIFPDSNAEYEASRHIA